MKFWALIDNRTSELVGVSAAEQTREAFEGEAAEMFEDWPRIKSFFTIREATSNEIHRVHGEFEWLTDVLDLRKRAMARPIDHGEGGSGVPVDPAAIVEASRDLRIEIGRWTLALTFTINAPAEAVGPRLFHASFRPAHPSLFHDPHEVALIGNVLLVLGAIPLPKLIGGEPSPTGVLHFEWPYVPEADA